VVMLEPDTMHGMAGGEARDATEGCVWCGRERLRDGEQRERERERVPTTTESQIHIGHISPCLRPDPEKPRKRDAGTTPQG
jgi:hypothetical protein